MKTAIHHWRWLLLTTCAVIVVALTTLPRQTFVMQLVERMPHGGAMGDAVGHASLFASLTAVAYLALRHPTGRWRASFSVAFWIALCAGLAVGLITELSQANAPGRTVSLSDALANWLGVFVMATLISYRRR
ncbi:MAG: VanZ family protein [Chloroflexota bacterium]|nr:VanZ family protein [Chloroflexota bacterium]